MSIEPSQLALVVTQTLLDTGNLAFIYLDESYRIQELSDSFYTILDFPDSMPIKGQHINDVFAEFVGMETVFEALLSGEMPSYRLNHVLHQSDGNNHTYLSYQLLPVHKQEEAQEIVILIEDSTDSARLEQALIQERNMLRLIKADLDSANQKLQQLNRLKMLFLSMSAHDLRTPLTVIRGYADLLTIDLKDQVSASHQEYLAIISSQSDWLERLIINLLALNQLEEGKLLIELKKCDLNQISLEVFHVMAELARSRGLDFTISIPEEPVFVMADPQRVQQVLYNLLGNALKYTFLEGAIKVVVSTNDEMGIVSIIDNGRGMSEEEQEGVFELYYRTEDVRRNKIKGTGLGLYIVKMLMEAQNGRVSVNSKLNEGSTFSMYFPLDLEE